MFTKDEVGYRMRKMINRPAEHRGEGKVSECGGKLVKRLVINTFTKNKMSERWE